MDFRIERMKSEDWESVRAIYRDGIATGNATFETDAPEWEKWDADHIRNCRIVARSKDQVVGWAALSPVSGRCVYAGVAEVSVYVAESARGQGVGKAAVDTKLLVLGHERRDQHIHVGNGAGHGAPERGTVPRLPAQDRLSHGRPQDYLGGNIDDGPRRLKIGFPFNIHTGQGS